MAQAWDTAYRIPTIVAVVAAYALATGIAWLRVRRLLARGQAAFAATREEFAADIALLGGTR